MSYYLKSCYASQRDKFVIFHVYLHFLRDGEKDGEPS